jgi:hypothetical protein
MSVDVVSADVTAPDADVRGWVFWGLSRIALGWVFLRAFLDKAFALGFATGRLENGGIDFFAKGGAWLNGGQPIAGFLEFGTKGPFKDFYAGLAGQTWVDWVYMLLDAADRAGPDPGHRDAARGDRRHHLDGAVLHGRVRLAGEQPVRGRARRVRDRPGRDCLHRSRPLPGTREVLAGVPLVKRYPILK